MNSMTDPDQGCLSFRSASDNAARGLFPHALETESVPYLFDRSLRLIGRDWDVKARQGRSVAPLTPPLVASAAVAVVEACGAPGDEGRSRSAGRGCRVSGSSERRREQRRVGKKRQRGPVSGRVEGRHSLGRRPAAGTSGQRECGD